MQFIGVTLVAPKDTSAVMPPPSHRLFLQAISRLEKTSDTHKGKAQFVNEYIRMFSGRCMICMEEMPEEVPDLGERLADTSLRICSRSCCESYVAAQKPPASGEATKVVQSLNAFHHRTVVENMIRQSKEHESRQISKVKHLLMNMVQEAAREEYKQSAVDLWGHAQEMGAIEWVVITTVPLNEATKAVFDPLSHDRAADRLAKYLDGKDAQLMYLESPDQAQLKAFRDKIIPTIGEMLELKELFVLWAESTIGKATFEFDPIANTIPYNPELDAFRKECYEMAMRGATEPCDRSLPGVLWKVYDADKCFVCQSQERKECPGCSVKAACDNEDCRKIMHRFQPCETIAGALLTMLTHSRLHLHADKLLC